MRPLSEGQRIINIRVTNKNADSYSDAHDGVNYHFLGKGKTQTISLEAARHIFGYSTKGADEKTMFDHVCKRWGWNTPENVRDGFKDIHRIWANFVFTPVAYVLQEQATIDTGALAEDREDAIGQAPVEKPKINFGNPAADASAA